MSHGGSRAGVSWGVNEEAGAVVSCSGKRRERAGWACETAIPTRISFTSSPHAVRCPAGVSRWRLADVRANRAAAGKGRGLNKKQRETVIEIPAGALRRVNLHLDL